MAEPIDAAARTGSMYADLLARMQVADGAGIMAIDSVAYEARIRGGLSERQASELNRAWQARIEVLVAPERAEELLDLLAQLFAVYNDCESCAAPDLARRVSLATRGLVGT